MHLYFTKAKGKMQTKINNYAFSAEFTPDRRQETKALSEALPHSYRLQQTVGYQGRTLIVSNRHCTDRA